MATGLFSSRNKSLRSGLSDEAHAVENQIAELRDEIASLARLMASDASSGATGIRKKARAVRAHASDAAHDLNLTAMFADHMVMMKSGRIERAGPPAEVMTDDAMEAVFGCRMRINGVPPAGVPFVLPHTASA